MIVGCRHGSDPTKPQPCPSRCPSQSWPPWMFGWGGKLRREYRPYLEAQLEYDRLWRAYADQFPDGRYHGEGEPKPPPPLPRRPERIGR
jgi:hypothetical protein